RDLARTHGCDEARHEDGQAHEEHEPQGQDLTERHSRNLQATTTTPRAPSASQRIHPSFLSTCTRSGSASMSTSWWDCTSLRIPSTSDGSSSSKYRPPLRVTSLRNSSFSTWPVYCG